MVLILVHVAPEPICDHGREHDQRQRPDHADAYRGQPRHGAAGTHGPRRRRASTRRRSPRRRSSPAYPIIDCGRVSPPRRRHGPVAETLKHGGCLCVGRALPSAVAGELRRVDGASDRGGHRGRGRHDRIECRSGRRQVVVGHVAHHGPDQKNCQVAICQLTGRPTGSMMCVVGEMPDARRKRR